MDTRPIVALFVAAALSSGGATAAAPETLARAIAAFHDARVQEEIDAAIMGVLATGASFDDVLAALTAGPGYRKEVETGLMLHKRSNADGVRHPYRVVVPGSYDPALRYPVHVFLHGGIERPPWRRGGVWWPVDGSAARPDRIAVYPASWSGSRWWQASQVENLAGILTEVKRTYNVDENRVSLFGFSDGATGVWFHAFRAPTPWASFVSWIGQPGVLANPELGVDGEMYAVNLAGRPFLVVNGGRDPVYPIDRVAPYLDLFRIAGAEVDFRPRPDAGHDMSWYADEREHLERFLAAHPRDPHPDRIVWQTDRTDRYNRRHWVVILEIGAARSDAELDDPNTVNVGGSGPAFPRRVPSGRIEVVRDGNDVEVRTRGVRRYKLLLSPKEFDFSVPVTVRTNGVESFRRRIEPGVGILLRWAAVDRDRMMLYGAEIDVEVP